VKKPTGSVRCFGVKPNGQPSPVESQSEIIVCLPSGTERAGVLRVLRSAGVGAVSMESSAMVEEASSGDRLAVTDLPALDGLLRRRAPSVPREPWTASLVLLAGDERVADLRRALRAGVGGILHRDELHALPSVLAVVAAGHLCAPPALRQPLSRPVLSQRERETLALAIAGFSNAEVATRLFVAPSTVKTHLSSAFQKLGVRSRSEAAVLVHDPDEGLAELVLGAASAPWALTGTTPTLARAPGLA